MTWRIILSAISIVVFGWINLGLQGVSMLATGKIAGQQFDNSDVSYIENLYGQAFFGHLALSGLALLIVLALIWYKPIRGLIYAGLALLCIGAIIPVPHAYAYYNQSDYAEPFFILPNESAFFIPDIGANQDSQTKFGSEEYLQKNKIAAKRFDIPHAKLPNSGLWSNFYVPSGRLIIVDRTPFSREWIADEKRGTSTKDEGVHCQSKEGLDITVGIAVGASVYEEDAAKFLFRFGVKAPAGDRTQPDVIFTSVFHSRSLAEVMDGPIRNEIQTFICSEFTARTFVEGNSQGNAIMTNIKKNAADYLRGYGITLDYIGWADTNTFAPVVQDAINRAFVATQDLQIATTLAPYSAIIMQLAIAEALRNKWNGAAPSSVSLWWLPSSLTDMVSNMFKTTAPKP